MAGNIRPLTSAELKYFLERYTITLRADCLVVESSNPRRKTIHEFTETFHLKTPLRKLNVTPLAIKFWREKFSDYHLIEVQNAVNVSLVTYQELNEFQLSSMLKKLQTKYQEEI